MTNLDKTQSKLLRILYLAILIGVSIFLVFKLRIVINSDSVSGFEAAKSYVWTHEFNYTGLRFDQNLNVVDKSFLAWWSPGQYVVPDFLESIFKIKFGIVLNLVTVFCLVFGLIGYLKLFRLFGFENKVILFSGLFIFTSVTFYYNLISYQGGEILSFCFFPWSILLIIKSLDYNKVAQILIGVFVILFGFFCKSAMLISYISVFVCLGLYKMQLLPIKEYYPKALPKSLLKYALTYYQYFLIIILSYLLLHFLFLDKGANPSNIEGVKKLNSSGIVTTLSSSLSGIGNINNIMIKMTPKHHILMFIVPIVILLISFYVFIKSDLLRKYKAFAAGFILLNSCFFIFLYISGSNIDESIRHLKFNFYLFAPILSSFIIKKSKYWYIAAVVLLLFYADFYRLEKIWANQTYMSKDGYSMSGTESSEMPEPIYDYIMNHLGSKKTICVSNFSSRWSVAEKQVVVTDSLPANLHLRSDINLIFIGKLPSIDKSNSIIFSEKDTSINNISISMIETK